MAWLKEGKNGFLINFGDENAMKKTIEKIIGDKILKEQIKKNNLERVKEFKLSNIAKQYLEVGRWMNMKNCS